MFTYTNDSSSAAYLTSFTTSFDTTNLVYDIIFTGTNFDGDTTNVVVNIDGIP